jgi:uncharacterized protein (DUF302 family)
LSYYISNEVAGPFERVLAEVIERLKSEGFGVLSDIDVRATLKARAGAEIPPYRILGACNPQLALEALSIESRLGVMLPCNVIVHAAADDRVEVASVDPVAALERTGNPALARIALEVRKRLSRVVQGMAA